MSEIVLATEDVLSEEVGSRLAAEVNLEVGLRLGRVGNGYLRSRLRNFSELSATQPVLLLTDLDRTACAPELLAQWFGNRRRPPNLIVRVAVREIESWLLADHIALGELLSLRPQAFPLSPDELPDPKAQLLQLARRAPREIRADLVPPAGAIASQGLGYNQRLCDLVKTDWDPARASIRSPSLRRTRQRLAELAERTR